LMGNRRSKSNLLRPDWLIDVTGDCEELVRGTRFLPHARCCSNLRITLPVMGDYAGIFVGGKRLFLPQCQIAQSIRDLLNCYSGCTLVPT